MSCVEGRPDRVFAGFGFPFLSVDKVNRDFHETRGTNDTAHNGGADLYGGYAEIEGHADTGAAGSGIQ